MNPKPFVGLNHLTVPIAIAVALSCRKLPGDVMAQALERPQPRTGCSGHGAACRFRRPRRLSPRHSHPVRIHLSVFATYSVLLMTPTRALRACVSDSVEKDTCDGRK